MELYYHVFFNERINRSIAKKRMTKNDFLSRSWGTVILLLKTYFEFLKFTR